MRLCAVGTKHGKIHIGGAVGDVELRLIHGFAGSGADVLRALGAHMHDDTPGIRAAQGHMLVLKAQFPDLRPGAGVKVTLFQSPDDGRVAQLRRDNHGPGAEGVAEGVAEGALVVVVVRAVDIGEFAVAQKPVIQTQVVFVAVDHHGAGVENLQAEKAVVVQNLLRLLHGPVGVVIGDQVSGFFRLPDKAPNIFPVIAAGPDLAGLLSGFSQPMGHILAEIGVIGHKAGVVGLPGQQVEMDLRPIDIQLAVG